MQITFLYILAIAICFGCGNRFSLVKRKYTKGYYFSAKHKSDVPDLFVKNKSSANFKSNLHSFSSEIENQLITFSITETSANFNQPSFYHNEYAKPPSKASLFTSLSKPLIYIESSFKPVPSKIDHEKINTGDTKKKPNKVLLAFLSLIPILCFIAVYLHDQKKVTINFWVALILHLTILGYAIFSLLVVFNAVDLR